MTAVHAGRISGIRFKQPWAFGDLRDTIPGINWAAVNEAAATRVIQDLCPDDAPELLAMLGLVSPRSTGVCGFEGCRYRLNSRGRVNHPERLTVNAISLHLSRRHGVREGARARAVELLAEVQS